MSSFQITKVRTVRPAGAAHEHIDAVQIGTSGAQLPRTTVVADLKNPHGDRYYTYGGGQYGDVILRSCPYCSASDYITTAPDSTTKNNLLDLPRF